MRRTFLLADDSVEFIDGGYFWGANTSTEELPNSFGSHVNFPIVFFKGLYFEVSIPWDPSGHVCNVSQIRVFGEMPL